MKEYYKYWEKRIFNAIIAALVRALATLQTATSSDMPLLYLATLQSSQLHWTIARQLLTVAQGTSLNE